MVHAGESGTISRLTNVGRGLQKGSTQAANLGSRLVARDFGRSVTHAQELGYALRVFGYLRGVEAAHLSERAITETQYHHSCNGPSVFFVLTSVAILAPADDM